MLYLLSESFKVRLAYATDSFDPKVPCDNTAPNAKASVVKIKGTLKSGYWRSGAFVKIVLHVSNALQKSAVISNFFFQTYR